MTLIVFLVKLFFGNISGLWRVRTGF